MHWHHSRVAMNWPGAASAGRRKYPRSLLSLSTRCMRGCSIVGYLPPSTKPNLFHPVLTTPSSALPGFHHTEGRVRTPEILKLGTFHSAARRVCTDYWKCKSILSALMCCHEGARPMEISCHPEMQIRHIVLHCAARINRVPCANAVQKRHCFEEKWTWREHWREENMPHWKVKS